jgi:hypothetical protein
MNKKHELSTHHLYFVWHNMRERCLNKKSFGYKYYGAKGVTICKEWDDFLVFFKWSIENGYEKGLTIDRINTYGNYTPDNCRYATIKIQANNKRKRTKGIVYFCSENGLLHYYSSILYQFKMGKTKEWVLNKYKYVAF